MCLAVSIAVPMRVLWISNLMRVSSCSYAGCMDIQDNACSYTVPSCSYAGVMDIKENACS